MTYDHGLVHMPLLAWLIIAVVPWVMGWKAGEWITRDLEPPAQLLSAIRAALWRLGEPTDTTTIRDEAAPFVKTQFGGKLRVGEVTQVAEYLVRRGQAEVFTRMKETGKGNARPTRYYSLKTAATPQEE